MSHATNSNASNVPGTVQEKAPEGLERNLPESVSLSEELPQHDLVLT